MRVVLILLLCLSFSPLRAQRSGSTFKLYPQISLVEMRILDTISHLREVRVKRSMVLNNSKGSSILKPMIHKRPGKDFDHYWVKVVEDSGGSLITHFNFFIDPKSLEIRFFDAGKDRVMTLSQWRRSGKKKPSVR